jgi:transposase-like protein
MGGKTKPPYPEEYRRQVVELYANGARIVDLAKEFKVSEQSIAKWVRNAGVLASLPDKGTQVRRTHRQARTVAIATALTKDERAELEQLRYGLVRQRTHAWTEGVYAMIKAHQAEAKQFALSRMCRGSR